MFVFYLFIFNLFVFCFGFLLFVADVFPETSGNLGSNSGSDINSSWEGSGAGRSLTLGETEGKPNGLSLVRMQQS